MCWFLFVVRTIFLDDTSLMNFSGFLVGATSFCEVAVVNLVLWNPLVDCVVIFVCVVLSLLLRFYWR